MNGYYRETTSSSTNNIQRECCRVWIKYTLVVALTWWMFNCGKYLNCVIYSVISLPIIIFNSPTCCWPPFSVVFISLVTCCCCCLCVDCWLLLLLFGVCFCLPRFYNYITYFSYHLSSFSSLFVTSLFSFLFLFFFV